MLWLRRRLRTHLTVRPNDGERNSSTRFCVCVGVTKMDLYELANVQYSTGAGVMTTLMRCGRDRRSGKPVKCHARKERALLVGTRSANHIRAGGHSGCTQRPDTWLHPNASRKRQIPLASRAPSIHGTFEPWADVGSTTAIEGNLDIEATSPRRSRWGMRPRARCLGPRVSARVRR